MRSTFYLFATALVFLASACTPKSQQPAEPPGLRGIATESFLADIAANVAGDRVHFSSLIPPGVDPHAFEPVPSDIFRVSQSQILIENGAGLETWLLPILENASGDRTIVQASQGLTGRNPSPGEVDLGDPAAGIDPHFWLDPLLVVTYVENIRAGLTQIDPVGADGYTARAAAYTAQLKELDLWIHSRVAEIPPEKRLLVTNHETLGYFADRYGFSVIGTIIPGTSTDVAPGAKDLASLEERIRATGAPALFVESGSNLDLAMQIGRDTDVRVVSDLYTHALSSENGPAPTYIEMMKHNVNLIVDALKGK
jgi:ABC-type Zn uptake system ZnuABC Zn-binding protein ZnuA